MRFILWYNILSIHQSAFVNALAEQHDVTVIVENALDSDCLHEQNSIPNMGDAKVIVAPDVHRIEEFIHADDAVHLVCGLDFAFRKHHLVQRLLNANARVLCYCEPYIWNDGKGWLRRIKYWLIYLRFGYKVPGILYMGDTGYRCMRQAGFRKEQLFAWGYFTETPRELPHHEDNADGPVRFIFAGRLDENKNCRQLLETMHNMQEDFRLTIVGDGRCRESMEHYWHEDIRITWKGLLPNDETQRLIGEHDVLVLPSKYDGWGAVINEALMHGTRVVCSSNCGAATLIVSEMQGQVFNLNVPDDLETALCQQIAKGKQGTLRRLQLKQWSLERISGKAIAEYFTNICEAIFFEGQYIGVPWIVCTFSD